MRSHRESGMLRTDMEQCKEWVWEMPGEIQVACAVRFALRSRVC